MPSKCPETFLMFPFYRKNPPFGTFYRNRHIYKERRTLDQRRILGVRWTTQNPEILVTKVTDSRPGDGGL